MFFLLVFVQSITISHQLQQKKRENDRKGISCKYLSTTYCGFFLLHLVRHVFFYSFLFSFLSFTFFSSLSLEVSQSVTSVTTKTRFFFSSRLIDLIKQFFLVFFLFLFYGDMHIRINIRAFLSRYLHISMYLCMYTPID